MVINKFPNREVYEKIKAKGSLGANDVNVLEDYSGPELTEADKTEIAGKVIADGTEFELSDFPTALKNPKALTFTGAALEANSSQNVSNDIELGGSGVTVRIKGSKANTDASTYRICYFNGTTWTGAIHLQNAEGYAYDAVTDTITFTSNSNALYTKLRFSYPSTTDSAAIVVTVNEAIE